MGSGLPTTPPFSLRVQPVHPEGHRCCLCHLVTAQPPPPIRFPVNTDLVAAAASTTPTITTLAGYQEDRARYLRHMSHTGARVFRAVELESAEYASQVVDSWIASPANAKRF